MQGAACDGTESYWWDRAFSAQRLDLEGKHTELLCDSGKSRTLVKHKWLIFTERAMTQSFFCVIYGVNAIVKYPGRFSCWLQTVLSHHSRVLSDSQVFASTCGAFCVAHYTKASEWSICVHTVHLTVAVFEVTSLQGISDVSRRGRQTNFQKESHLQERKESKMGARLGGGKMKRATFCKCIKRIIFSRQPRTIIHHPMSKDPYPFKNVDSELDYRQNHTNKLSAWPPFYW